MKTKNDCFHKLEIYPHPPYRYKCTICGKLLKVASGHYPVKDAVKAAYKGSGVCW